MNMYPLRKEKCRRVEKLTVTLLLTALLSACGGSDSNPDSSSEPKHPFQALGGQKTLLVHVDGLTLVALQNALPSHPTLEGLGGALPLRSGGYAGTATEQQTVALPSWASLVTGTWSIEHGLGSVLPSNGAALQVPTVFEWLMQEEGNVQTSLVVSTAEYAQTLQKSVKSGAIKYVAECSQDDTCVTQQSQSAITQGADFVLAQYSGLLTQAAQHGLGAEVYRQSVEVVLNDIEALLALIAERESISADESWQIVLVNSYGMDEFGTVTGSQFERNKTGWMLSNLALSDVVRATEDPARGVLDHAAIVDVMPTVLAGMGIEPVVGSYAFNGNDLRNDVQMTQVEYDYNPTTYRLTLEWGIYAPTLFAAPIDIYRDGQLLASVDANTRQYIDTMIPSGEGGSLLPLRYELRTQDGATAIQSIIVPPPKLEESAVHGLVTYYPFKHAQITDVKQSSTMTAWNPSASGQSWVSDPKSLPYREMPETAESAALAMDLSVYLQGGFAGYRMDMHSPDVTMDASVESFTIGFWFKTDGNCLAAGTPILANKNYSNKSADGMAIGLFTAESNFQKGMCSVRFNTGGGRSRDELRGFSVSAGEWAYVAMSVDKKNKQLYGYVIDTKAGQQNAQMTMADARLQALPGDNKQLFGIGNDTSGQYSMRYKFAGVKSYTDLAVWDRLLTLDELENIYASRYPLYSLLP